MKYLIAFLLCSISSFSISQNSLTDGRSYDSPLSANGIEEISLSNDFKRNTEIQVYPNPARHTLYIKGYFTYYNLFDDLGRKLDHGTRARIDVTDLKPGMYIMTIHDRTGKYKSKKIRIL